MQPPTVCDGMQPGMSLLTFGGTQYANKTRSPGVHRPIKNQIQGNDGSSHRRNYCQTKPDSQVAEAQEGYSGPADD